jgi:hypothetical protein
VRAASVTTPALAFISVPPFGSGLNLRGKAYNFQSGDRVVCYIFIEGLGWWIKPTIASPTTPISADGTWTTDITTGGVDQVATEIAAFLIPAAYAPPLLAGAEEIPLDVLQNAKASAFARRNDPNARILDWAGQKWRVKSSYGVQVGPGPNYFTDSPEAVWVDADGLHLKAIFRDGRWHSAEVVGERTFGFGSYQWVVQASVADFPTELVLGLFTWSNRTAFAHTEIDIEHSKQLASPFNSQFVDQPFSAPGNLRRFNVPAGVDALVDQFVWGPTSIFFQTSRGTSLTPAPEDVIDQWLYTGSGPDGVPPTTDETVRINLWWANSQGPADGMEREVVLPDFRFVSGSSDTAAPAVAQPQLSPGVLPPEGGVSSLSVAISDAAGVQAAVAEVTRADAAIERVPLVLASGSATNGVWTGNYLAAPNLGPDDQVHGIRVLARDESQNQGQSASANLRVLSSAPPSLMLTYPNGGELHVAGSNDAIIWNSVGLSGNVKIDYSTNGGTTWLPIYTSTENDEFAVWTVQGPPTAQARIRITSLSNPAIVDTSDGNFTIAGPSITVTYPDGGEPHVIGTNDAVNWNSAGITGNVKIDYSNNGGASWFPIYASTENDGFAVWTVQGPPTTQARIRVTSLNDPAVFDISNSNFIINPSITLTYPNGGEVHVAGTNDAIVWNTGGVSGNVKLEYSNNGGTTWIPIYNNTENDGNAVWTVQGPPTTQARVRITSLSNPANFDISNGNFIIR